MNSQEFRCIRRFFELLRVQLVANVSGIRRGNWKFIWGFEDAHSELFNLADDLGEKSNLVESEPERVLSLQRELFAWQKDVGAKSPEANKKFDHSKPNGRFAARPKSSTIP